MSLTPAANSYFPMTLWTLVRRVSDADPAERERAFNRIMTLYWPPVYSYLRRDGCNADQAEELTQAFFVEIVFSRKLLERADESKGRLRSLLVASLKNFRIGQYRHDGAAKRALGNVIGGDRLRQEEAILSDDQLTPDETFDRRWALVQFNEAIRRCENHFREAGRASHWQLFESRVLRPALSHTNGQRYEKLAPAHGFGSAPNAAAAVQVVKKRFLAILREIVAETTADGDDQEDEFTYLLSLLR